MCIVSTVSLILAALFSINFTREILKYQLETNQTILQCKFPEHLTYIQSMWPYFDLLIFTLAPFVIIFTCNISIICLLNLRSCQSVQLSHQAQSFVGITLTLSMVSLSFIICMLPTNIYILLDKFLLSNAVNSSDMHLLYYVSFLLYCLNSSINFLLYCLSGSAFRRELLKLCCSICQHRIP